MDTARESLPVPWDSLSDNRDTPTESEEKLFIVMSILALEHLPAYALTIRRAICAKSNCSKANLQPPKIGASYILGEYVFFPITFPDGLYWLLKVPTSGSLPSFDAYQAEALRSEALVMMMLRRKTTIPVPDVYAFSKTCANSLNHPFILLQGVKGKNVYDVWFDKASRPEVVKTRRIRILNDIAEAMAQLEKFSFDHGGSLMFDENARAQIGQYNLFDDESYLDHQSRPGHVDNLSIHHAIDPISDTKELYTAILDRREEQKMPLNRTLDDGERGLLRMFIDRIPEPDDGRKPFVLHHTHFSVCDFVLSTEGTLQAIINWEAPFSAPRSMGNERHPSWLTRDWDPLMYNWNEEMERGIKPGGLWEDSPSTLKFYRSVYAKFMQIHRFSSLVDQSTLTAKSLICENLFIASRNPANRSNIVEKIFKELMVTVKQDLDCRYIVTKGEGDDDEDKESEEEEGEEENSEDDYDLDYWGAIDAIGEGSLSQRDRDIINDGFDRLMQRAILL
ncbi:hypothetical protein BO71DRAFT_150662 [Aspergillus ellipticus CBS 707.79]|uniref:Aminoglycoside phosphotransferase domain-containing protein n=1 Tax=Aspergillus ellipticus CBS 707.79 TaxID=1448320 RepID=A0A319CU22_9EURO|nr:hypothetical protein BO71DRAFT_150662 [Aspergillus ellipticus CBS 707.79]